MYPAGLTFRIWRHAVEGRFVLLVSPAIVRETAKVLRRFQWQEDEIVRYLKLIAKVAEIVTPTIAVDAVPEDETDKGSATGCLLATPPAGTPAQGGQAAHGFR
jgi:hypothetical protein